jgi:two-component system, response regulator, stage 0 sporulation protein F
MPQKTILIVEDQQSIRILLAEMLKLNKYETLMADNGQEAITLVESHQPDAVILDLKMPGMDGVEVLSRIRKAGSDVPVIIMTAYGELQIIEEAKRLGIHTNFTKPFDIMEMLRVVHGLFAAAS